MKETTTAFTGHPAYLPAPVSPRVRFFSSERIRAVAFEIARQARFCLPGLLPFIDPLFPAGQSS